MLLSIISDFMSGLESNIIASEKFFGGLKSAECLPECSMIHISYPAKYKGDSVDFYRLRRIPYIVVSLSF